VDSKVEATSGRVEPHRGRNRLRKGALSRDRKRLPKWPGAPSRIRNASREWNQFRWTASKSRPTIRLVIPGS
jgi:hypothetical protein